VQSRLAVAQTHGATHGLALNVHKARAAIEKLTYSKRLDVAYDITGHPMVLAGCIPVNLRRLDGARSTL
jgi:threonine dehydrogenase-like Zn-dependent dehydrogenase